MLEHIGAGWQSGKFLCCWCDVPTNSLSRLYTMLSLPTVLKLPCTTLVATSYNTVLTMPLISKGSSWYKRSCLMHWPLCKICMATTVDYLILHKLISHMIWWCIALPGYQLGIEEIMREISYCIIHTRLEWICKSRLAKNYKIGSQSRHKA